MYFVIYFLYSRWNSRLSILMQMEQGGNKFYSKNEDIIGDFLTNKKDYKYL